jgi:hypothetical protein
MKKILAIIILGLCFITPSQADDIKDFQIEGISILDSLTKFISKGEILKTKKSSQDVYKSDLFYSVTFFKNDAFDLKNFDEIQFHLEKNDSLFKIHALTGAKYISDKGKCLKEFNNAKKDLDNLFKGAKKFKKDNYEHASQRGFIYKHIVYQLDGGKISVKCDKWDKDIGIKDSLVFDIYSKKISNWLNTKAY